MHFTRFLRPLVAYMRSVLRYRVLWYLDDLLIAPAAQKALTAEDCLRASALLDRILARLGIARHPTKGVWGEGAREIDHLGFHISTVDMTFTVTEKKQGKMRRMAGKLLRQAGFGKGMVSAECLTSFCGSAVSLMLAVPLARFYTRSLYDCLTYARRERDGKRARVRLSKAARRDLMFWRKLGPEGRCMREPDAEVCTHSDAADLGWGGTVSRDMRPGENGVPMQGIWTVGERAMTIAWRELRALRLVLERLHLAPPAEEALRGLSPTQKSAAPRENFSGARAGKDGGVSSERPTRRKVLCWVDNSAVVHIVKSMVTASREMMPELRLLNDVLERERIVLDVRWIASAENRYADRQSRTWDPSVPQCTRAATDLLRGSLSAFVGRGMVFRYRMSGGEHPVAQRKQAETALEEWWGDGRARFFNPPPALLGITLSKMEREKARGILVVPFWTEDSSTARLRRLAERVTLVEPQPGRPLVAGAQTGTETCPLLLAEFRLQGAPKAGPAGAAVAVERALQALMKERVEKTTRAEEAGRREARARKMRGGDGRLALKLEDFRTPRGFLSGEELCALVTRVREMEGNSAAAAELMAEALEISSWKSRATHMRVACLSLEHHQRDFPMDERDLVAFVGFLYTCLVRNSGPQIGWRSVPNYVSGIRLTHGALGLGYLPTIKESLRLTAAFEGYKKAADRVLPPTSIRIAIPAHKLYEVLNWAQRSSANVEDRRDAAMVIGASVFGLRCAGALSIKYEHTSLDEERWQVLVEKLKGRTLQAALRRGGRSFYNPKPVDGYPKTVLGLIRAWVADRGTADGYFFDGCGLRRCNLDRATKRVMREIGFVAPPGCDISGHSPRITAFTQAVLLEWSDTRLRIRFDWKNLADMADVYLDHRVRTSQASRVFFSPELPDPVARDWGVDDE